jgi:hypothetical protein
MKGTAVFLDTSIQIARIVHSPLEKRKIAERISEYDITASSVVVRQEFKRRLLKEAKYLIDQLNRRGSFHEVFYHVEGLPALYHNRKRHICLQMLGSLFENASDRDLTERLKLRLHFLLTLGLKQFDKQVDQVLTSLECGCNKIPIRVKKEFASYEFGTDKCSEAGDRCGILAYLIGRRETLTDIYKYLKSKHASMKTEELLRSEAFLERILIDPSIAQSQNPCLTVGDLLIAIESSGIPTFYTLNQKESQFFCDALGQELIVRPIDPLQDDIICRFDHENRPAS